MANDVSIRLGVDGEKEFRDALKGIDSQIKNLNSEMQTVVTSMNGMGDTEETAAKKTDILGRSIDATKQKVALITGEYDQAREKLSKLGSELDQVKKDFGDNSVQATRAQNAYNRQAKAVNDLGTQLNNATSDLNRMEKEMRDIERGAKDTGNALDKFGNKIRDGFTVAKGVVSNLISDGLQALVGSLANLAGEAVDAADSMTKFESTMSFAGFSTSEIESVSDAMQQYASRTVYDLQTVANTVAQLGANGVANYEQLTEAAGNLNAVAGGNADTFQSVAMVLTQTAGAGKLTTENWNQLADAIPGASGLLQEAMRENGAYVGNFREAMEEGEITSEEFNQAIMQLGMTDTAQQAAESVATVEGAIGNLKATIVDAMTSVLTDGGGLNMITSAINEVTTAISSLISAFQEGGFAGVMQQARNLVSSFISNITTNGPALIQSGAQMLTNLAQGIGEAIPEVLAMVPQLYAGLIQFITENYPKVYSAGIDIIKNIALGIINGIPDFIGQLPAVIGALTGYIQTMLPTVAEKGLDLILSLAGGIITNIPSLVAKLPQVIAAIVQGLGNLMSGIVEAGLAIVEGLWDGISSGAGWLLDKIKGWAGSILDGIKGFFGIHSPSTVMRDQVGLMITEGVAAGISKGENEVLKTADELNQKLIEKEDGLVRELEEVGLDEATKTALTSQLNAVKEFRSEYEKAIQQIESSQESMADKLSSYGDLFKTVKTEAGSFLELGDLEEQTAAIEQYGEALETLKGRGVSDSLMSEITSMDIDDALNYTNELLNMTGEEYDRYMKAWEEKQAAAQEVAKEFYQDEMDALQTEFVDKIPEELSDVKDEMRTVGTQGIQGMIDGMYDKSGALYSAASSIVSQAISAMRSAADIHSPSKKTAELVGAPMGEGVAVGFLAGLEKSRAAIEAAMLRPISRISRDDMFSAAAATVNGMAASGTAGTQTVIIPVNLNGKQIAEVVFDPLKNVAKQRGVAFG